MPDSAEKTTLEEILQANYDQTDRERKLLDKSIELLNDAKGDPIKTADAIKSIVQMLLTFDDGKQETMAEYLGNETHINKTLLRGQLKKARAAKIQDDKVNGEFQEAVPIVDMVEMFITRHFKVRYNDISNQFEMLALEDGPEAEWQNLNENNIYRKLQKQHIKYSISDLISLLKSDFTEHYNPIVDYFNDLPEWDGEDHINNLAQYIKLHESDRDRFDRMFRKMFIRSVACSLEVTFNKQSFILVHEKQNSGKSTFLRWLCPPELEDYYTENINTDKDSLIALTENFIINLDELSTLSKFEINALKSVMSKDRIKVRIPYDRRPSHIQRRCNFVGSTNRVEFLNDETGSVRWICFRIDSIDWDYMQDININQVWAQAFHLFRNAKNKYAYQLTVNEIEENEQANRQFIVRTEEMEFIQRFYMPGTENDFDQFLTASDVKESLQKKINVPTKFSTIQIGKSMALLGFKREQKYSKQAGYMLKGYYIKHNYDDYTENKNAASDTPADQEPKNNEGKQGALPF